MCTCAFSSVQISRSVVSDSLRLHESQHQASLSVTSSRSSLKLMSIESVMPSSHLFLCRPLLLLPPIPPSMRVFSNESTLRMRWLKYWSFSFSIIPSKEIPGLIILKQILGIMGFPGGSNGKEYACNARDLGSIPGSSRKILWKRKWQPSPVYLLFPPTPLT